MSGTATTVVDTGVEGCVVHGPLPALLALELPRTHAPAERVAEFTYRLVRPVFSPATVVAPSLTAGVRLASVGAAG